MYIKIAYRYLSRLWKQGCFENEPVQSKGPFEMIINDFLKPAAILEVAIDIWIGIIANLRETIFE